MPQTCASGFQLRYDGKVALVTGGGNGMGREHAILLASRGARTAVMVNSASVDAARSVVQEIVSTGGEAIALSGLIGNDVDAYQAVRQTIEHFGRIDIIIHSEIKVGAGTNIQDEPSQELDEQVDINIRGPMQINRAAWPYLQSQKYGRILFTGSAASLGQYQTADGYPGAYSTTKAGVFGLARQTAAAGQDFNIKANILLPWAYTAMAKSYVSNTGFAKFMEENLPAVMIARGGALLVHELCPVTGQAISIAGGRITRVFFASPEGYFNRDFTPEDILQNWNAIEGTTGPDGLLHDTIEITSQAHEKEIVKTVNSGL